MTGAVEGKWKTGISDLGGSGSPILYQVGEIHMRRYETSSSEQQDNLWLPQNVSEWSKVLQLCLKILIQPVEGFQVSLGSYCRYCLLIVNLIISLFGSFYHEVWLFDGEDGCGGLK